jgi:hypothetical protein
MRRTGLVFLLFSNLLLVYLSVAAPFYARAHPHLDHAMLSEYAAPWPVALGCSLAIAGIMLVLVPIRSGERWALWTLLAVFIILLATRLSTDPRCLVVLDPHQHGCHTFMIAMVLGIAGVALVGSSRRRLQ